VHGRSPVLIVRSNQVLWRIAIESLAEGRSILVVLVNCNSLCLQWFHTIIVHRLRSILPFLFRGKDSRRLHYTIVVHLLSYILHKFHFQVTWSFSTFDLIFVHERRLQLSRNASIRGERTHTVAWELPACRSIASSFKRNSLTRTCFHRLASVVCRLRVIAERLVILEERNIVPVDNLVDAFHLLFAIVSV